MRTALIIVVALALGFVACMALIYFTFDVHF